MMATNQAYGDGLAKRLRAENVAATITRLRQNAIVAITEARRDNPLPTIVWSTQQADAYDVRLLLRDRNAHQHWVGGVRFPVCGCVWGDTYLFDRGRFFWGLLAQPYHFLLFYLSREALNAIADDVSAR